MRNGEEVHPRFNDIEKYINKTKFSTTVEIRKKFNSLVINTVDPWLFSKEEIRELEGFFSTLNVEELLSEIEPMIKAEEKRIRDYQMLIPRFKRNEKAIGKYLSMFAPSIIEEIQQKKNFYTSLKFAKNNIGFFIKSETGKNREIIEEYIKRATKIVKLTNEFDQDDENYFVKFTDTKDIQFMASIVRPTDIQPTEGFTVLGIPIQVIIYNCRFNDLEICHPGISGKYDENPFYESIKHGIFAFNNRIQIKKYSTETIRAVIEELMRITGFKTELYLACYIHYNYLLPIMTYTNKRDMYFEKNNIDMDFDEFKLQKNAVYQQLIKDGKAKIKWKNEVDLYKLVLKEYPDAVYQYRAEWLERQSLDIYIPSLNIGIEFQGEQHYEPVAFFGGVEGFEERQRLDKQKMQKCKQNDVKLIQWKFTEAVTKTNLKRYIKALE